MQQINMNDFPNSSGWHVIHDVNTQMYKLKAMSNGKELDGVFTSRVQAESALRKYLMCQTPGPGRKKKSE